MGPVFVVGLSGHDRARDRLCVLLFLRSGAGPSSMIAFSIMTCGFMLLLVGANTVSKPRIDSQPASPCNSNHDQRHHHTNPDRLCGNRHCYLQYFAAAILIRIGTVFMSVYQEAPVPVFGMVTLYFLTALSFVLCALVIVANQQWTMRTIPSNWAEDLNAIMAIIGITGIGALSLSFTQARIAKRHANEARIDSLTGLLNRRAVFSLLATTPLKAGDAAIAFDLDGFKAINDTHGHAAGDRVLEEFANILRSRWERAADRAARRGRVPRGDERYEQFPYTGNCRCDPRAFVSLHL